jgi:diacylglycerol kinase (ATP)
VKTAYSHIFIIFNPNSTGGKAPVRAQRLERQLKRRGINNVDVIETEFAGHAEELAYDFAVKYKHPLIISVSGDGGYHEVINGALKAIDEDPSRKPVCAIRAAGNANDHRRSTRQKRLITAICKSEPIAIDVLKMTIGNKAYRYAHSYIGLGPSAHAAILLNDNAKTRTKALKMVFHALVNFKPFYIRQGNHITKLDSLIFSNIRHMSMVMRLNMAADPHDGIFDVIINKHEPRWRFLYTFFKILLFGVKSPVQATEFSFRLLGQTSVHLDAEPIAIKAHSKVKIETISDKLFTLK